MKLISMTEFVLEQLNEENSRHKPIRDVLNSLEGYAKFLQQELTLSMFLPLKKNDEVLFRNVSFDEVDGMDGIKFYRVGNTQVFNIGKDGDHLYWHHNTIESLLSEFDETIEFNGSF